jgi:hypothetical protein
MESPLQQALAQVNAVLIAQGKPYTLEVVDPATLKLLDKNARYMAQETFANLTNNIKVDGDLTSFPLCYREPDGKLLVLSGNHRTQAAIHAKVKETIVLVLTRELSREERVARQLSHNAISGKDDPVILKDLWDEIKELDLKMYAGLDSEILKELDKMQFVAITEAVPDFKQMVLLFLPEEVEELKKVLEDADTLFTGDENVVVSRLHYDRVFKLVVEIKDKYGIVNNPTAFMKIVELARAQMQGLEAGAVQSS